MITFHLRRQIVCCKSSDQITSTNPHTVQFILKLIHRICIGKHKYTLRSQRWTAVIAAFYVALTSFIYRLLLDKVGFIRLSSVVKDCYEICDARSNGLFSFCSMNMRKIINTHERIAQKCSVWWWNMVFCDEKRETAPIEKRCSALCIQENFQMLMCERFCKCHSICMDVRQVNRTQADKVCIKAVYNTRCWSSRIGLNLWKWLSVCTRSSFADIEWHN